MLAFFYLLLSNISNLHFLCGCGWLYGTCIGCFGGFMAGCEAVAMGQGLPLG